MDTKFKTIAILTILSLTMMYGSCKRKLDCTEVFYNFNVGLQIYPDKDSIYINDTLWLELNIPKKLKDLNSGVEIDYSNAENLGSAITIVELLGGSVLDPGVKPAIDSFGYKLVTGQQIPSILPNQINAYNFNESQTSYNFKLGIITKRKGIYGIGVSNADNVFRKNEKCSKANFKIKLIRTNNHIYYLEQSRPGYIPSELEKTNTYYFKVK